MYSRLDKDLRTLRTNIGKLSTAVGSLPSVVFTVDEQELILRVFKSITPQLKSVADKTTARSILDKVRGSDEH